MKLNISQRLNLPSLLPQKGGVVTLTLKGEIQDKLRLTSAEIEDWGVKEEQSSNGFLVSWDTTKDTEKEIEFTKSEIELIRGKLAELDKNGELDDVTFSFWKLFN
jgi:hypothetical protein